MFTEKIQFKNSLPVWGYSFPSTSQVHKFFQSMHIEWSKQWLPYILPIIFLRGTCVHTLCPTWSISLTIPGRVWFIVRTLTMQALFGQQTGCFLETQASLHLFSADDVSRISRCPGDHLDLLLFPGCQISRNPEQMYLSHWISCRQNF